MTLESKLLAINDKKAEYDLMKKNSISSIQQSLGEIIHEIFLEIPKIKQIFWHQYSPFFNDGDECIFRIDTMFFFNHDSKSYFRDSCDFEPQSPEDWCFELEYKWSRDTRIKNAQSYLSENEVSILTKFNDILHKNTEFIEEIFGNHKLIICNKDGITIQRYEDHN